MHNIVIAFNIYIFFETTNRKVMDVLTGAEEYKSIPVRKTDEEPLQKIFATVKSELFVDNKNMKPEETKFWKQHPALVKVSALDPKRIILGIT